jgi:hypothetical protein
MDKCTLIILCTGETQMCYINIIQNIIDYEKIEKIILIHCYEQNYSDLKHPKIIQYKYWYKYAKHGYLIKYMTALEHDVKTQAIIFVDDTLSIEESTCNQLLESWQKNKQLVHGNNFLSLRYNFAKNKYTLKLNDSDPHIILTKLCIVSQKYVRQTCEYISDLQDIFDINDPTYSAIDVCLSIITACQHESYRRTNVLIEDLNCKISNTNKSINWENDIYSDICTITIKKFFDNKTIDYNKNPKYPNTLVVLPFFNFAGFKTQYINIHDTVFKFNSQNINVIVSEAILTNTVSQLYTVPCKILTTETDTIAFHKEGLFNKVFNNFKHLFDNFVICDSDIIFADDNWVDKLQKLFATGVEVLQPYSTCHWTDKNGNVSNSKKSYSFIRTKFVKAEKINIQTFKNVREKSHPGFVWAFTKGFLERTNGLYSKCFTGSGDEIVLLLAEGLPNTINENYRYLQPDLNIFLIKGGGKHGSLTGEIYHLYHGNRMHRKYVDRHINIKKAKINLGQEYFSEDLHDYLIKAIHPKVNEINLAYFKGRREDD